MFKKSSKKKAAAATFSIGGMCQYCSVTTIVLGIITVVAVIAALVGVYKAHFLSAGLTFGTLNGSASLIALALTASLLKKLTKACPCQCALPSKK
ncbi:hypothetical protein K8942_05770 [Candidatus Peribacteria bacterium]|nr:MAG: hypothetical protein K8942_05770 [Candidatus Peribacteria bacterium]